MGSLFRRKNDRVNDGHDFPWRLRDDQRSEPPYNAIDNRGVWKPRVLRLWEDLLFEWSWHGSIVNVGGRGNVPVSLNHEAGGPPPQLTGTQ